MQLVAAGVLAGTFLLQFFSYLPSNILLLSALIALAWMLFFLNYDTKYTHRTPYPFILKPVLIFSFSLLVGLSYANISAQSIIETRLQSKFEGKDLIIEGHIVNIPQQQQDHGSFYFDVQKIKLAQMDIASKTPFNLHGKIKLSWYQEKNSTIKSLKAGQQWRFQVRLKQPNGFMNQGGFDYEKWLFTNRVKATGYIRSSKVNHLLATAPWYSIHSQRQMLSDKIKQSLPQNNTSAGLIAALAVADRHGVSEQQWTLFQQTGTSHLIAISGLHIGIVAGFGYLLIAAIWWLFPALYQQTPVRIAGSFLAITLAVIYALLAGFTLPTQRSLIMVIAVVIALLQRQQIRNLNIISIALLSVLLIDPLAPMSASFWLSFGAVLLILLYSHKQLKKPRLSLLWLQLMLSLGMFPLTILFFGSASLVSPLANLIAIPWVTLIIVPFTLLAMLSFFILPSLSQTLLQFVSLNIDALMRFLEWLDAFSYTSLDLQQLPTSLILVMMLSLLFLFLPKGFPAKWLGLLLLIPVIRYQPTQLEQGAFKYSLLDIGQGAASLIETQHHRLIYDAGPKSGNHFDTGKLVFVPFLQSKGISSIDKMVLSHEDIDHRGGAGAILKKMSIKEIISSDRQVLLHRKISPCQAGKKWQWDQVHFEFLHPDAHHLSPSNNISDNNRSCVLRIFNQHHSLLLTGDIEKPVEQLLLKNYTNKLPAEILLIPHHGSKTSSSIEFLTTINPKLALNTAGYRNKYRHPAKKIMQRYQQMKIPILHTANKGQITLHFPASNAPFIALSYREQKGRFWNRK